MKKILKNQEITILGLKNHQNLTKKQTNLHFRLKIWQRTLENGKNLNFDLKKQEKVVKLEKKWLILEYFSSFLALFWCIRVL